MFPVVLVVSTPAMPPPPASLAVTPSNLSYVYAGVNFGSQLIRVTVAGIPAGFTATSSADPGLAITLQQTFGQLSATAFAPNPGTYYGSITITAAGQSGNVAVSFVNTSVPGPILGSVVSAASQLQGAVSAGEIIALHGSEIGPGLPDPTLVRVLFDGVPATSVYESEWQVNAVVPDQVAGKSTTQIALEYNGARSETWGLTVAPSSPAIFTLDGTGLGQAAVLNQDSLVNGPSAPAAADSVIRIFGTGAGATPLGPVSLTE